MTKKKHLWRRVLVARLAMVLASLLVATAAQAKTAPKPPNIIFIVADDLGYGNLTSYNPNSRIPTPHIDQLAKEGTKFTRFYAGSTVCAPSRCALLTGRDMGHAYIRGNGRESLREQDKTLAQYLQASGYRTGMFGKWGQGEAHEPGSPEKKGFDAFFGYINQGHAHDYFTDRLFELKDRKITLVPTDTAAYAHDLIMDRALAFLKANKDRPFFLFLPVTIPHAELKIPQAYMKPFLHADGSSKFGPETPFVKKGNYSSQPMPRAAFAAMINKLDQDVGRLSQLVKELGLDDNTYIFLTSDNGPHQEGGGDPQYFNSSGPLRGIKRDLYEGGIRVPMLVRAPGKVPAGRTSHLPWAFWDVLPTLQELTGGPIPAGIDGLSFAPAVAGKPQPRQHDYLYWQFKEGPLQEALIQKDWKLIRLKAEGRPEVLELYHLGKDPGEKQDVAAANPKKVKELQALMKKARTPAENKRFDWSALY